jgi:hypothetical protein
MTGSVRLSGTTDWTSTRGPHPIKNPAKIRAERFIHTIDGLQLSNGLFPPITVNLSLAQMLVQNTLGIPITGDLGLRL